MIEFEQAPNRQRAASERDAERVSEMNGPTDDECGDTRTQRHVRRRWGVAIGAMRGSPAERSGWETRNWQVWGVPSALLVAALAVIALAAGGTAVAGEEIVTPQGVVEVSSTDEGDFSFFRTFAEVQNDFKFKDDLTIPISWVPGAESFKLTNATVIIEADKHRISLVATPEGSTLPALAQPMAGFWLMADWDDSDDVTPELTLAFRFDNIRLDNLNNYFAGDANDVPVTLRRGWVVFSSDVPRQVTLADIPDAVKTFFGTKSAQPAISAGTPLQLNAGANFVGEIDLLQNDALKQTVALAGVKELEVVVRGTLSADASSLFGDGDPTSLLDIDLTATLDATGDNPPPWLTNRQFEVQFSLDELQNPFIGIGDRVTTLIDDASNTFKRGVQLPPGELDGSIPLLLRFELEGPLSMPFGIDVWSLLDIPEEDAPLVSASFTLGGSIDLTKDDWLTSLDVGFEIGLADTKVVMDIDTEPNGDVTARFAITTADTLQSISDRLAGVLETAPSNLDPLGQLGVNSLEVTIEKKGDAIKLRFVGVIGTYDDVFGIDWLDLTTLTLDAEFSTKTGTATAGPAFRASLTAVVEVNGVEWAAAIEVGGDFSGDDVALDGAVTLSLGDGEVLPIEWVVEALKMQFPEITATLPDEMSTLSLRDVELGLVASRSGDSFEIAFDAFATTTIPIIDVDGSIYLRAGFEESGLIFDFGLRPTEQLSLGTLIKIPGLHNPEPGGVDTSPKLPALALVVTTETTATPGAELTPAGFEFYKTLHGCAADTVQPERGETKVLPTSPSDPGTPTDPEAPTKCFFTLQLQPGVNLVANLAVFPDVLDPLIEALWMDPDQGLQFIGHIPFFGGDDPLSVGLKLRLPEIVPPREVDFLTGGELAIGVRAGSDGFATFIEGELGTRWRRSEANPSSCDEIGGDLLTGYDLVGDGDDSTMVASQYCYDVLRFNLDSAIGLSTSGLTVKLAGGVIAESGIGWEEPFGVSDITIRSLKLALQVGIKPGSPVQVSFTGGFAGDIIIGDPDSGGKQFSGSAGAGFAIVPAPTPAGVTIVPEFVGVRGYVSSIGLTDVARLWAEVFPEAPTLEDLQMPLAEIRNAEFMMALGDNSDLCLKSGIYLAGELYVVDELSAPGPVTPPPTDDGGCAEFGALVDPDDTCLSDDELTGRRDDGCFATFFGQLALTGIVADGRIGALELDPVRFDDAQFTFKLTATEQAFIIRGGFEIVKPEFFSGQVAAKVGPFEMDLYGKMTAFGFSSEVDGRLALAFGNANESDSPLEARFHVVLGSDFERVLLDPVIDSIEDIRRVVVEVEQTWERLTDSDYRAIFEIDELIVDDLGVELPQWIIDVIDAAETAYGDGGDAGDDALKVFFTTEIELPAGCPLGFYLDTGGTQGECRAFLELDTAEPSCGFGQLSTDKKTCTTSFEQIIDTLSALVVDGITDLLPIEFTTPPSLSTLLGTIVDELAGFGALDVECAEFTFDASDGTPLIDLRSNLRFGETTYGVGVPWDMDKADFGVSALLDAVWKQIFGTPAEVTCTPAIVPDGISPESFAAADVTASPTAIDEGETVAIEATFTADPGSDVQVRWGDGSVSVLGGTGTTRTATHRYLDDPSGTDDSYEILVLVDGGRVGSTTVTVRNVAPSGLVLSLPERIDEAAPFVLTGTVADPGIEDRLVAKVWWRDGSSSRVPVTPTTTPGIWEFVAEHAYSDDNPSGTPDDDYVIAVTVDDSDGGAVGGGAVATVFNIAPTVETLVLLDPADGTLIADDAIDEDGTVTFAGTFTDPGLDDTHVVEIDWGDGSPVEKVDLALGARAFDADHRYLDDNPPGTAKDDYTITVTITDDDTGVAVNSTTVWVRNVDPVATVDADTTGGVIVGTNGSVAVSVQYSDPIAAGDGLTVRAHDVAGDPLTAVVEAVAGDADSAALAAQLSVGPGDCIVDAGANTNSCTWTVSSATSGAGIYTDLAPGAYDVRLVIGDDDLGTTVVPVTVTVLPEDARLWYTGPLFAATESARDGTATVELRATIRDVTSTDDADPQWDPWPGDIRRASMTFVDRGSSDGELCSPASVDEVFAPFDVFDGERSIGVGTCPWTSDLGSKDAEVWSVGTVAGGYYTRDESADYAVVTIAKPLDDFITGGGYLVATDSTGVYASTAGSHANFGFHVKFNKKGTNLQGGVNLIVRSDGRVYQIKSNAMDSLGVHDDGVNPGAAEFESKANITDITDDNAPMEVGGNYLLQMRMTDLSEADGLDSIGFSLWDIRRTSTNEDTASQLLLYSSNWNGDTTRQQVIAGGNLMVHAR